jgi:hypothetical protein
VDLLREIENRIEREPTRPQGDEGGEDDDEPAIAKIIRLEREQATPPPPEKPVKLAAVRARCPTTTSCRPTSIRTPA